MGGGLSRLMLGQASSLPEGRVPGGFAASPCTQGGFFPRELRQRQGWLQDSREEGPPVCVPKLSKATTMGTSCCCLPLPQPS